MTSPSREAFEAWADARDATHAGKLRIEDRGFDYPLGRVLDECWQAAIQHARDVAVMACEGVATESINEYDNYHDEYYLGESEGASLCADAIKEALK